MRRRKAAFPLICLAVLILLPVALGGEKPADAPKPKSTPAQDKGSAASQKQTKGAQKPAAEPAAKQAERKATQPSTAKEATSQPADSKQPEGQQKAAPSAATKPAFENAILWDDFEEINEWVVESACAPAKICLSADKPSHGKKCLKAQFTPSNRAAFELRREVKMDLTMMDYFLVDVYVAPTSPMTVWVGFRTGAGLKLFETPPKKLVQGWNRDIVFDLRAMNFKVGGSGENDRLFDYRDDVRRINLNFGKGKNRSGVIYIDNIRFVGNPPEGWERRLPRIVEVLPSATAVKRFEKLEIEVRFRASYTSHFDTEEIDLWANLVAPDGRKLKAYGFFYGRKRGKDGKNRPVWLIRFTPNRTGRWEYDVTVKNSIGEDTSKTFYFDCTGEADSNGFIRRSTRDSRFFEYETGKFFYPIGQNICWAGDYEYYFKKMRESGENFVRIWICPWNFRLEPSDSVGEYDLEAARKLDEVIDLARRYGLAVQLVLVHHGMLNSSRWADNPYNSANGGPCESPADFFTDKEAKKLFKRMLRYIAARWGYATNLFAWELFNEVDLTDYYSDDDVVKWHNEMTSYLKSVDVHGHLITTSCYGTTLAKKLNVISRINFTQAHLYSLRIVSAVEEAYRTNAGFGKPFFVGEFGGGTTPEIDMRDPRGVILHAGLWSAFMTPSAGNAMPWWWDTLIDPQDLYYHFRALANFAEGEDRRGKGYKPVKVTIELSGDKRLVTMGLLSQTRALLWIYDPDIIEDTDNPERSHIPGGSYVWLTGMPEGDYDIEFWDTYEGKVINRIKKKSYRGRIQIVFPEADADIACKVIFKGRLLSPALVTDVKAVPQEQIIYDGRTP